MYGYKPIKKSPSIERLFVKDLFMQVGFTLENVLTRYPNITHIP